MSLNSLYDISVYIVGALPPQYNFIYALVTLVISIIFILLIFTPFIIAYKLIGGK